MTGKKNCPAQPRRTTDKQTMKIALTILCSLLLVLGQAVAVSAPAGGLAAADCGCGGKMACCQQTPVPPAPPAATVPAGSQNQMVSPIPAVVAWVLAPAGTASISPPVSPLLTAASAPIFARHCAWRI